jgi:hypothetical protein
MRRWVESCMVVGRGSLHMLESQKTGEGIIEIQIDVPDISFCCCYVMRKLQTSRYPPIISLSLNQTHSRRHT